MIQYVSQTDRVELAMKAKTEVRELPAYKKSFYCCQISSGSFEIINGIRSKEGFILSFIMCEVSVQDERIAISLKPDNF